jgi:hypothetical protein
MKEFLIRYIVCSLAIFTLFLIEFIYTVYYQLSTDIPYELVLVLYTIFSLWIWVIIIAFYYIFFSFIFKIRLKNISIYFLVLFLSSFWFIFMLLDNLNIYTIPQYLFNILLYWFIPLWFLLLWGVLKYYKKSNAK